MHPPRATALLVIDPQNDFLSEGGAFSRRHVPTEQLAPAIAWMVAASRQQGRLVVWVTSVYGEHGDADHLRGETHVGSPCCARGSWGAEVIAPLRPFFEEGHQAIDERDPLALPHRADLHLEKHWYSAFRDTRLQERLQEAGVARVIIGTRAAESLDFVRDMARTFGSERIAVGIDAKNGLVSTKGWTETSELSAFDLARRAEDAGAGTIIYTDIATDGMMQGPNFAETEKMLGSLHSQLIASGGVSSVADVQRLGLMPGLYGCIIGKALYDGAMNLREVVANLRATAKE